MAHSDPTWRIGAPDPLDGETTIPRLWRPRDLARRLGLARQTIYTLIRRGHLPAIYVAGAVRVREIDVVVYLKGCPRVQPRDEAGR
jgi:excisionase family DNA binding protein